MQLFPKKGHEKSQTSAHLTNPPRYQRVNIIIVNIE